MQLSAGIDLGGSKILTALFDEAWQPVASQRIRTPTESYQSLIDELIRQIDWLRGYSTFSQIGLGLPGVVDRETKILKAANLTADQQTFGLDICEASALPIRLINDSKAFALSEACLGSGQTHHTVLGISIGTGMAAGLVVDKRILSHATGMAGEIGHMSIPAYIAAELEFPMIQCACGSTGCYETYLSGPGLTRLGKALLRVDHTMAEWSELYRSSDQKAQFLTSTWFRLLSTMLAELVLCYDPDCIVLGGGATAMPDFLINLQNSFLNTKALTNHRPDIALATVAEFSGARGAALHAAQSARSHNR